MLVTTLKQFESAVAEINQHEEVVVDTETNGLDWAKDHRVVGVPVLAGDRSYYFSFRHAEGPNLPEKYLKRLCKEVLPRKRKQLGFHYAFDMKMLAKDGYEQPENIEDSLLGAHILNENEDSFKMEELGKKYLDDHAGDEEDKLIDLIVERFGCARKSAKGHLWRLPASAVAPYGEQDVRTTRALRDMQAPHLKAWKLDQIYREQCEFQRYIVEMEMRGIPLDLEAVDRLSKEAESHARRLRAFIERDAGYKINLNSYKQVCAWLGVPSSSRAALVNVHDDPRVDALLDYRQYARNNSAYYDPYRQFVGDDGCIRYNLSLTGTVTSRLASRNKGQSCINITAIPRDSDKYKVKDAFVCFDGYEFLEVDYSQAELRFAAHYSQDEKLTEIILSGVNMHDVVSKELNMPRSRAKNVNFSAWYGIGPKTFAKNYNTTLAEAKKYLGDYHGMFTGIRRLINYCENKAESQGYIRMFSGRVRHFNHPFAPTHTASNGLIQGGVAEMLRIALMRIRRTLPHVLILTPIHDAGLFALPKKTFDEDAQEICRIMQDQPWCSIPMLVDAKRGHRWGQSMTHLPRSSDGIPLEVLARTTDPSIQRRKK